MKKKLKNIAIYLAIQASTFVIIGIPLVFKGPLTNIKETWVLTAMTTMTHQYLATWFVPQEEIDEILKKNQIKDPTENANINDIKINKSAVNQEINIYDTYSYPGSELIYHENGIKIETFKESKFRAYVTIIDDPSKVKVATTENLGVIGEKLTNITNRCDAIVGINAGGFVDVGGHGNGGKPLGIVIENYEEVYSQSEKDYNIVGFTKDNVLVVGKYTKEEVAKLELRDAISFRPFLIINGNPQITSGNGGWGIAPRTAIGQRKDGKVIFLTIDGRQATSVGATLKEVQDIMLLYGAYNCSNLDGGSSTQLVLNNKTINKTSGSLGPRHIATSFIVEK